MSILLTLALVWEPESTEAVMAVSAEEQLSDTAAGLNAVAEGLLRPENQRDEDLVRPEYVSIKGIDEPARQIVESPRSKSRGEVGKPTDWISVLDRDIARVLVERGLTPYDPNVAGCVREAGNALRAAKSEYAAQHRPLTEDLKAIQITYEEYSRLLAPFKQQRMDKREKVIEELEAALDALSQQDR